MKWWDCSSTTPVDEVGGEELDVCEGDTRGLRYLQERFNRCGDPKVMGQRPSDGGCGGVDICED